MDLDNIYTYHPPTPEQVERYEYLRNCFKDLAKVIRRDTPQSREQSVALTNLEQACFWANAAIARNE